ncbi:MAG TPA: DUF362 domain-containing protein [Polyangiaceae bacterium]|jgi:uncharacterized protein (DUF362 family)|nr:DUF362 domain-containing protein [Polyangiaceae bacterium]
MNPNAIAPKVIIRHCDAYYSERIREILRDGMRELGIVPKGRTLVKPNLVSAGEMFPHAHTRPEFAEGLLLALQDVGSETMTELAVGERCGITIPTRYAFKHSGFDTVIARTPGVKKYFFEEEPQVEVRYTHEKRLRDYVFVPEPVAKADFMVNAPKFKAHPWTTVTFSMKNYIGIQDDRHRLIDHDHRLNEKIADLQYVIQPQFIAIDAIIAGEGRMLTPKPFEMNLIIMGNNQVAFDAVCCAIIGVNPRDVDHIRLASERGFGTLDLSKIEITGDVTLEQAQTRAKGFEVGLIRVEKYFEGTSITAYAGPPPDTEHTDYCWGGCPGAIEEAIEILRTYDAECDKKMPRLHVVFGAYEGPIDAKPGEKVIFIGDCATWKGDIAGNLVSIESLYKDRSTKDPHKAEPADIKDKILKVTKELFAQRHAQHVRLEGCPVSVAEQVFSMVSLGNVKNPYLDPPEAVRFSESYVTWKAAMALKGARGQKYQVPGACSRGEAAPRIERGGGEGEGAGTAVAAPITDAAE